jgi:uncharacterized protein YjfI (DUF2170 family)
LAASSFCPETSETGNGIVVVTVVIVAIAVVDVTAGFNSFFLSSTFFLPLFEPSRRVSSSCEAEARMIRLGDFSLIRSLFDLLIENYTTSPNWQAAFSM